MYIRKTHTHTHAHTQTHTDVHTNTHGNEHCQNSYKTRGKHNGKHEHTVAMAATHINDIAATNQSTNSSTYTYSVATTATHRHNDHMGHGKHSVAPTRLTRRGIRRRDT